MSETVSDDYASELGIMAARGHRLRPETARLLLADRASRTAALRVAEAALEGAIDKDRRMAQLTMDGVARDRDPVTGKYICVCADCANSRAALAAIRAVLGEGAPGSD